MPDPSLVFAIFAAFAAIIVVAAIANAAGDAARKDEIRALAAQRRWGLVKSDRVLPATFNGPPFGVGWNPQAQNLVRGMYEGRPIMAFDYSYVIRRHHPGFDNGEPHWQHDNDETMRYWVVCVGIRPAAVHATSSFGPHPAVLQLLETWPDFPWRIDGDRLITWGAGELKPHWLDPALNMLTRLAATLESPPGPDIRGAIGR